MIRQPRKKCGAFSSTYLNRLMIELLLMLNGANR